MPEHSDLFLSDEELVILTGRSAKRLQVEQLRRMLIPFHINARGKAVVTRTAVEGGHVPQKSATGAWQPKVVSG